MIGDVFGSMDATFKDFTGGSIPVKRLHSMSQLSKIFMNLSFIPSSCQRIYHITRPFWPKLPGTAHFLCLCFLYRSFCLSNVIIVFLTMVVARCIQKLSSGVLSTFILAIFGWRYVCFHNKEWSTALTGVSCRLPPFSLHWIVSSRFLWNCIPSFR